jgi:uncharacterized iron-regulated membrane protein
MPKGESRVTKIQLRNLWFQVHKWLGLILAVLIIPISLTGSALVWHDPIEKAMHPARHAVAGPGTLAPAAYADAARAALGEGEMLTRLQIPGEAGEPVAASASKPGKGRPQRVTVYLDPANARVIDKEKSGEGILQVFHQLHGSLLVPGVGRQIVGWVGVAMLISSLTGLWLWWPVTGSVRRGFRWKRHRNLDNNLHYLVGFWISLPLFVLSLTGVWISFPQVFAGFDGAPQRGGIDRAAMARAKPLAAPVTPLAAAVERAQAAAPGRVSSVTWPTDLKPEWAIDVAPGKGRPASVTVNDSDGVAKVAPAAGPQRQTIARLMRQIHDGNDMPLVWQLIVFLGGIIPAILAVTGIIMWWRARKWRGDVAERRAAS